MDDQGLASLMAQVATELQDERDEEPTVEAIVHRAVGVVPGATVASITVRARRGRFATLAASAEVAREADRLQYDLGQGPCVDVAADEEWIRSGVLREDPRWRRWGPAVSALGLGSVLSVPLSARGERIGALNVYSKSEGDFADAEEVDLALLFAVHAAHALAAARLVHGLEIAVSSRHAIGVAQGILVERFGLTVPQAFDLLQRLSSQTQVKVAALARHIIETGSVPTVDP